MKQMIKLTEIQAAEGQFAENQVLVNRERIVSVHEAKLSRPGPHLLGTEHEREVRHIMLAGGRSLFVNDSFADIEQVIAA